MWKNKPPFHLALSKVASDETAWHCRHYTGRGVMKFYELGAALAQDMGVPVSKMEETVEAHYQASSKTDQDPDGGLYPAYRSRRWVGWCVCGQHDFGKWWSCGVSGQVVFFFLDLESGIRG